MCSLRFAKAGSAATLSEQIKTYSKDKANRFYLHSGNLNLAAMYLRRVRVAGRLRGGADAEADVCRRAWGDGAHCPCAARYTALNDLIFKTI
jgi:hypothetical protein